MRSPFSRCVYFDAVVLTHSTPPQLIDSGNAVPLYLAACHYNAKQLLPHCVHAMAMELAESEKNKQWEELPEAVRASVKDEHQRLLAKRKQMRQQREMLKNMPAVLAPGIS